MLYLLLHSDNLGIEVIDSAEVDWLDRVQQARVNPKVRVVNRTTLTTFAEAEALAARLGDGYVAVDSGPSVSPRYDVIRSFRVGEPVSKSFNGDSYPIGRITRIGAGPRMTITVEGEQGEVRRFHRRGLTGRWLQDGRGPFALVHGVVDERNPHL